MKKNRLRKEVKKYFKERVGAIFFLVVVAVMSILVANTSLEQQKSTNPTNFPNELVQKN